MLLVPAQKYQADGCMYQDKHMIDPIPLIR